MGEGVSTINGGTRSGRGLAKQRADEVLNSRKFKSAVTRASKQTDWNDHGGARVTLAKAFGYKDMADRYMQVNKEHESNGSLTLELSQRRNNLDNEMEKRIKRDFGEKGVRAFNKGLS